jgi:hypothetical protein
VFYAIAASFAFLQAGHGILPGFFIEVLFHGYFFGFCFLFIYVMSTQSLQLNGFRFSKSKCCFQDKSLHDAQGSMFKCWQIQAYFA